MIRLHMLFPEQRLYLYIVIFAALLMDGGLLPRKTAAQSLRHEVSSGIQFVGDETDTGRYIVNDDPVSSTVGRFENDFYSLNASYTFFFQPFASDASRPLALQRFYTRPSTLRLYAAVQPEAEASSISENPDTSYRFEDLGDNRAREAGLDLEYFLWKRTALNLGLHSVKNEEWFRISNTLGLHGNGEINEIRRYYTIGATQYVFKHVKLQAFYTDFTFEYRSVEDTWDDSAPLSVTQAGRETDTDGYKLLLRADYLFHDIMGIQAFYEYTTHDGHSRILSPLNENSLNSTYHDDMRFSRAGASLRLYCNTQTTLEIGGSLGDQELIQTYQSDQTLRYDWDRMTLHATLEYDVTRHLGIRMNYEFLQWDGDGLIEHPQSASDLSTTFTTTSERHVTSVNVIGRF